MLYGPFTWADKTATPDASGAYPSIAGPFCYCEPSTFAAFASLLTPYQITTMPEGGAQGMLVGDNAAAPSLAVYFHFPDWTTAENVCAQVNGPVATAPTSLPEQVAMERVVIVLDEAGLTPTVLAAINALPEPQKTEALDLWNRAPNLVVDSAEAQMIQQAAGITDAQMATLVQQAAGLAL